MLREERNYDFKTELLFVHKQGVRKEGLLPQKDEFAFADGVKIFVEDSQNRVIMTAVRDFEDYLFTSMDISASIVKKPQDATVRITLGRDLGEATGYMGYRVTVERDGVKIEGHDERGVAQALYYLEDLMNIRKAPFLTVGKVERRALFSPRITQSPFGMYAYPDEAFACGSASITRTFLPNVANEAARLIAVVVFPTPPFWLAKAIIFPIFLSLLCLSLFATAMLRR